MDVKVLGPLEAQINGKSMTPTAGKPRQILAMLALEAGRVVPVPTLIEELWGMRPPRSALTTLQTYIMQLRRLIDSALASKDGRANGHGGGAANGHGGGAANGHGGGAANGYGGGVAKDVLVTRCGGYQLNLHGGSVDVQSYERLAAAGARAAEATDYESASRLLRSALDVWRGRALVDVQTGLRLGIEVIRLEESKLGALELCIDSELRLGRHPMLLSELAMLTASYPMHEQLCAQFMVALYRSGQQWRALEAYKRLRDTLVCELGVEPSARLQHLHRAILNSDPTLDERLITTHLQERLAM
jgi:SARP family transcriptional regulator, regulator of embCAB operon